MLTPARPHSEHYQAPRWLPGGHLQTIYAALLAPRPRIIYKRERWDTPDGDFIDVDCLDTSGDGPLVVIFHGLEGSSRSHYALALMEQLQHIGWRGTVPHFRGCGGKPNRLPRAYFAGDSTEIGWILHRLRTQHPDRPLCAAGFSLGGNALLKWLGEQGDNARTLIDAAVAVSAPMDLHAAGDALDRDGFNLIYRTHFLRTLKRKALEKLDRFPRLFDRDAVGKVTTLRAFDNLVTAPLHGFRDTSDYWTKASSKPGLITIGVPTLIINARNDPFLPYHALPKREEVSASVTLDFPEQGGHVGFLSGAFPGKYSWLPKRITGFFSQSTQGP